MREVSAGFARRAAVAAQGLAAARPAGAPGRRTVNNVVSKTRLLQLDSVSAVVRAHYAPVFSRIGPYDRSLLDELAWADTSRRPRQLVEYWAHEAALIPVADWPLFRWRMTEYEHGRWAGMRRALERNPALGKDILDVIADAGACSAGEVERHLELDRSPPRGSWWDLSDTKLVCEQLFAAGALSVARRESFRRYYDLSERVIPNDIAAQQITKSAAIGQLLNQASAALGIASLADLRDYYRLPTAPAAQAVTELVNEGVLEEVSVAGWDSPAYLRAGQRVPRAVTGAALLCPFDPLVFFRPRIERIFSFRYRIEIYTPEHKRVHGYYVFPFLLDGELVGRVDLRADRKTGRLLVPAAFAEPGHDNSRVAAGLAGSLLEMAQWLELDLVVGERGNLAGELRRAVAPPHRS